MNYLSVEHLTKTWQDEPILKKISFGLNRGDKIALVSKNGGGKSTLLNIIIGKDTGDSGQAILRKEIQVAYLSQEPFLDDNLSIIEQVLNFKNETTDTIKA